MHVCNSVKYCIMIGAGVRGKWKAELATSSLAPRVVMRIKERTTCP